MLFRSLVKAPVDLVRTALSATMGLLQVTGSEVAYLVDPNGKCISAINPREKVTIAFGVNAGTTGCAAPCPTSCVDPCPAACPTPCADPCPAAPCSSPCCD